MRKAYTNQFKVDVVEDLYNHTEYSTKVSSRKLNLTIKDFLSKYYPEIHPGVFWRWRFIYDNLGKEELLKERFDGCNGKRKYTKEFKDMVIEECLNTDVSQIDICKKYNIRSPSLISSWLHKSYKNKRWEKKAS